MVKALDLFCGAGGAGWGLLNAGWDAVGVDLWGQALRVHRANVGPTLQLDLLDPRRWGELPAAELVWASPRCR